MKALIVGLILATFGAVSVVRAEEGAAPATGSAPTTDTGAAAGASADATKTESTTKTETKTEKKHKAKKHGKKGHKKAAEGTTNQ